MTREEAINFGEMFLVVNEESHNSNLYEFVEEAVKLFKREPAPDNSTNGDMIKAMFPYAIKDDYIESSLTMEDYVTIYLGDYKMRVSYDWLIAPYEAESEEKKWEN